MKIRRCMIPLDGFYEWKREGKAKQHYLFRRKDEKPFVFAGLWETWNDMDSFSILTTSANELMSKIHDRMPVILSPVDYDAWLDPAQNDPEKLKYLFEPFPSDELT